MKAQYVYENISFERGKDPMKSLGIGIVEELNKEIRALSKDWGLADTTDDWELASWINPYTAGRTFYLSLVDEENLHSFPKKHWPKENDPDGLYIFYQFAGNNVGLATLKEFREKMPQFL